MAFRLCAAPCLSWGAGGRRSGWRGPWKQEPSLWLHEEPQTRSCGTCPEGHGFLNYLLPGGFFGPRGPISRGGQRAAPLTWVTCARTGGEKPGRSWKVSVCLLGNYPSQVLYVASSSQGPCWSRGARFRGQEVTASSGHSPGVC